MVGYPSVSLASCFYFLLFLMCHYAVNRCDKLRFSFIFAVLSSVSVIRQGLLVNFNHGHTHIA